MLLTQTAAARVLHTTLIATRSTDSFSDKTRANTGIHVFGACAPTGPGCTHTHMTKRVDHHDLAETRQVRGSSSLGELLSRCGRHSSASEGVHIFGGFSPISPDIPKTTPKFQIFYFMKWMSFNKANNKPD
jgi:hypothetical protein